MWETAQNTKDLISRKIDLYSETKEGSLKAGDWQETADPGLNADVSAMAEKMNNPAWRPLRSRSGPLGAIILFFKKIARKCLKFYVEPIAEQQTEYNISNQHAVAGLVRSNEESRKEIGRLRTGLGQAEDQLRTGLGQAEDQLKEQSRALEGYQKKMDALVDDNIGYRFELEEENARRDRKLTELADLSSRSVQRSEENEARLGRSEEMILENNSKIDEIWRYLYQHSEARKLDGDGLFEKVTTAQSGEDSIVIYILRVLGYELSKVRYLDLGANHAKFLSNTYALYHYGARGVLLEANPALIPELEKERPGDVVVNKCLSEGNTGKITFYVLNGDGLSSADREAVRHALELNPSLKIEKTIEVDAVSVNELLDNYFTETPEVINIDIEGEEINILKQMDFETRRPLIIIAETIPYRPRLIFDEKDEELITYLKEKDYTEYAFTGINSIFVDRKKLRGLIG